MDIGNEIPPARRPSSLPDIMTPLWDLFESCWSVDPASRPTTESVMGSHRRWHDDYERAMLTQSSPVQDIVDSFLESLSPDANMAPFESESSDEDVSTASETMPVTVF